MVKSMHAMLGQKTFRIQRRLAAHAGGGDGLAVHMIGHIAGDEAAFDFGGRAVGVFQQQIALVIGGQLAVQKLRDRRVADGQEKAFDRQFRLGLGFVVDNLQRGDGFVADHIQHLGVPVDLDFRVVLGAVLHDLAGAHFAVATAHEHVHLAGELGEVGRFFNGAVAGTHHSQFLIAEHRHGAVAHGAGGDAAAGLGQADFVVEAEPVGFGAGGDDDRFRQAFKTVVALDQKWALGEVHRRDILEHREQATGHLRLLLHAVVGDHAGAHAHGLREHRLHQIRAADAMREAGKIFHFTGEHQLAAGQEVFAGGAAGENQRLQIGAGGVDGGGPAGGAGADDDDFFGGEVVHGAVIVVEGVMLQPYRLARLFSFATIRAPHSCGGKGTHRLVRSGH